MLNNQVLVVSLNGDPRGEKVLINNYDEDVKIVVSARLVIESGGVSRTVDMEWDMTISDTKPATVRFDVDKI